MEKGTTPPSSYIALLHVALKPKLEALYDF